MFDLERLIFDLKIKKNEFANIVGKRNSTVSTNIMRKTLPKGWLMLLEKEFPDVNFANYEILDLDQKPTTLKKYTSNIKVLEKDIRLVPLINRYAYASYSESWNDNEFIESMELLPTFHQEDGNYLWFEIKGDSMTRNDDPSLNEGDYVLGRELYNHHWMNLQLRRAKVWVINHRVQGLMVKEVVKQKDNVITCHSWNPIVPHFDVDLNEVNSSRRILLFLIIML